MTVAIRNATPDDAAAIAAIYGHYVLTSCATFEETPPGHAEMRARMEDVRRRALPYLVAGTAEGEVLGFSYASPFHRRAAYRWTVEDSVYVSSGHTGQGIGTQLLRQLIHDCEGCGYRQMIAVIGDSANEASIRVHARAGFRQSGFLSAVGFKLGHWVDVVQMQLALGAGATTHPAEPQGVQ